MKLEFSMPIRVEEEDYKALKRLKEYTGISLVKLIHFAVPLLKKKYKFKEEENGEQNV